MSLMEPTREFRITGWHVLAGMVAFFGVIITVNAVFLTVALRSYPGEVSVTPYEDGLAYNSRLAQQAAQKKLGWRAAATAEDGAVLVEIADRQGAPVTELKLSGHLQRPATEAGRIEMAFSEVGPGRYRAAVPAEAGAWDLWVQGHDQEGRLFEAERRLTWR
ncbi:FixH family protein [Phenylobacterium sp.]|uniref:FixH family protein n=1 Tax=Phenylobacterium sp. TaxID=1871053 RepID=UPI0019A9D129|nr:FixH family protein [Phenylobacterium sp.]MBC7169041.1 FixH family protein [Phenylobacterium sp.]